MILTLLIVITILQIKFQFLSSYPGYLKSAKTIKYLGKKKTIKSYCHFLYRSNSLKSGENNNVEIDNNKNLASRLLTNEKANSDVINNEIKKDYKNSDDIFGSKNLKEFLLLKKSSQGKVYYFDD
jgi:hypothetical protein